MLSPLSLFLRSNRCPVRKDWRRQAGTFHLWRQEQRDGSGTSRPVVLLLSSLLMVPFGKALPQSTSSEEQVSRITAALQQNDFNNALKWSEQAGARYPGDVRLWTLKALALSRLHRTAEADASYARALKIDPEFIPALKGSAELLYNQHSKQARGILEHLVRVQPGDPVAQAMLGELDLRAGMCAEADAHLVQAGNVIASQPELLKSYSKCLVSLNNYDRAVRVFDRLATLDPSAAQPRYDAALALVKLERWQEAIERLSPLLSLQSPTEDEFTLAALAYEQNGKTEQAVALLRQAIQLYPTDQNAYLDFVNLAYRHESVPVGLEIVTLGVKQNPNSAELHFARGVLLCGLGRIAEGLPELETADRLNPNLAPMTVANGIAHTQAHHSETALAQFRRATVEHPQDGLAWYLLAEALAQANFPKDSAGSMELERAARRAIELKPEQTAAYDLMATYYLQAGRFADAAQMSEQALKQDPQDVQALYHLVLTTRKSGDASRLEGLVQRLVQARAQEAARTAAIRVRTLSLSPGTSTETTHP